jgi:hypothetical protein
VTALTHVRKKNVMNEEIERRKTAAEKRLEATRAAMMPGQVLASDMPKAPKPAVTWATRLWKLIPVGTLPAGIADELAAAEDTSSLRDADLTRMAEMLRDQGEAREKLRTVLLGIAESRRAPDDDPPVEISGPTDYPVKPAEQYEMPDDPDGPTPAGGEA